jgi:hypothetical protein
MPLRTISQVTPRRDKIPAWLLVVVPASGWVALVSVDAVLMALDSPPQVGLHSVFIAGLVALSFGASLIWLYQRIVSLALWMVRQTNDHITRQVTDLYRIICRENAERTEPLLRVVGTATVVAPALSPTMAAMRRLAEKVTGSTTTD